MVFYRVMLIEIVRDYWGIVSRWSSTYTFIKMCSPLGPYILYSGQIVNNDKGQLRIFQLKNFNITQELLVLVIVNKYFVIQQKCPGIFHA